MSSAVGPESTTRPGPSSGTATTPRRRATTSTPPRCTRKPASSSPTTWPIRQSLRGVQRRGSSSNDPTKVGRMVGLTAPAAPDEDRRWPSRGARSGPTCSTSARRSSRAAPGTPPRRSTPPRPPQHLGLHKLAQYMIESVFPQGEKDEQVPPRRRPLRGVRRGLPEGHLVLGEAPSQLLPARRGGPQEGQRPHRQVDDQEVRHGVDRQEPAPKAGSSGPEKDLPPDAEELRAAMVSPEQRYLLKEIEETPERIGPYLSPWPTIYKHSGRLKEAEEVLAQGGQGQPGRRLPQGCLRRGPDQPAPPWRSSLLPSGRSPRSRSTPSPPDQADPAQGRKLYKYELKEIQPQGQRQARRASS